MNLKKKAMCKICTLQKLNNGLENYSEDLYYGDYHNIPNFSIEMETGTGKTYVYLRSK